MSPVIMCMRVHLYMYVCVCICVRGLITHIHSTEVDKVIIQKEMWKIERYVHVSKTECNIQGD